MKESQQQDHHPIPQKLYTIDTMPPLPIPSAAPPLNCRWLLPPAQEWVLHIPVPFLHSSHIQSLWLKRMTILDDTFIPKLLGHGTRKQYLSSLAGRMVPHTNQSPFNEKFPKHEKTKMLGKQRKDKRPACCYWSLWDRWSTQLPGPVRTPQRWAIQTEHWRAKRIKGWTHVRRTAHFSLKLFSLSFIVSYFRF